MNDGTSWPELRRVLLEETQPAPGFEQRILSGPGAAPAARRSSWAIAAAAAALTILIVVTLLLAGRALQRTGVPAATPTPPAASPAASGPPPALSTRSLSSPTFDPSGAGWVIELDQQPPLVGGMAVMHTVDAGAHWTSQLEVSGGYADLRSGPAGQALVHVMGLSTGVGAAARPAQDSFYSTGDGGAHWQRYPPPAAGIIQTVQIQDGREAWLTMEVATGSGPPDQWVIYHTADGARTWQRLGTVDLAATFGASNVGFSRSSNGRYGVFIPLIGSATPTRLYTTSDGGVHWQGAPMPAVPGQVPGAAPAVFALAEGHLAIVGQGVLLASDDGGQHWSAPRPLPPSVTGGGVEGLDSGHWWLTTRDGRLFSSADEGGTWTAAGTLPKGMTFGSLAFSSPTVGWTTASYLRPNTGNALLATTDGGRTWRSVTPPHPYATTVPCGGAGATVTAHAHLGVSYDGRERQATVPAGVGVTDGCRYRLTTADTSGTIDVATAPAERGRVYTLGDFLDVWGVPDVASMAGAFGSATRVTVLVDGRPYSGDPRTIPLRNGTRVVVQVTAPTGGG